jgi:hypothetical protein
MEDIYDMSKLLSYEKEELASLLDRWIFETDYGVKDLLRKELKEWDMFIHIDKLWRQYFESSEHRVLRARARMRKFNVSIYPWVLEEVEWES